MLEMDPKTYRYRSRRPDDRAIRERLHAHAALRRRFGYRRLGILLARDGIAMNHKKLLRLYREEKLAVRRRRGRKHATGPRTPAPLPQARNQRWSMECVADQLDNGRRLRMLTVVDDYDRSCVGIVANFSLGSRRVAREFDRMIAERRKPAIGAIAAHWEAVIALVLENHPYRALADFRRIALRCLHRSILSRVGASGKPGAVEDLGCDVFATDGESGQAYRGQQGQAGRFGDRDGLPAWHIGVDGKGLEFSEACTASRHSRAEEAGLIGVENVGR
jgi:transposase InsO family protein